MGVTGKIGLRSARVLLSADGIGHFRRRIGPILGYDAAGEHEKAGKNHCCLDHRRPPASARKMPRVRSEVDAQRCNSQHRVDVLLKADLDRGLAQIIASHSIICWQSSDTTVTSRGHGGSIAARGNSRNAGHQKPLPKSVRSILADGFAGCLYANLARRPCRVPPLRTEIRAGRNKKNDEESDAHAQILPVD